MQPQDQNSVQDKPKQYNTPVIVLLAIITLITVTIASYLLITGNNKKKTGQVVPQQVIDKKQNTQQLQTEISDAQLRAYLKSPLPTESPEKMDQYRKMIAYYAKPGDLRITKNCIPYPVVLKVKMNSNYAIKNEDTIAHTLTFAGTRKYSIQPNASISVKADFENGFGGYGYQCDAAGLVSGYIFASEND